MEALLGEIRIAIQKAGKTDSLAFDTWGVDFGLLDADGKLLEDPVHYRDERTKDWPQRVAQKIELHSLYVRTGNQILAINTLFQLLALQEEQPDLLRRAKHLLFIPDLLAAMLGADLTWERSIASTSQMWNPVAGTWDLELLRQMGMDPGLFGAMTDSGSIIGALPDSTKIIAVAGHDTQCAVAAMPVEEGESAAFLSCGTWSLIGCELETPILTKESCDSGLSNEYGANGRINYLKNIIGLWLIQESRREYARQGEEYSFGELAKLADEAEAFHCFIDPDAQEFVAPGNIPERIQKFCRRTGQPVPETVGETVRCIYESLALKYRYALEQLEGMTGKNFTILHILGGGANAGLLCQMTADACRLMVKAGPVEATALGNILIQLKALHAIHDIDKGRRLIAVTEKITEYAPQNRKKDAWENAYHRFVTMMQMEKER
jgi:sugar (pentulose or hexulose) kinase